MYAIMLSLLTVLMISPTSQTISGFEAPFLKDPYLLYAGTNSEMTVIWQLETTQSCTFEWGIDTTYGLGCEVTTEYGDDHQHSHTMTGLNPGILHFYQVTCGSDSISGSFYSAPPESASDIKFFVYGDTRTLYTIHNSISQCLISAYSADPEYQTIVLGTGDLIEFGAFEPSWQMEFFNDAMANTRQQMRELPFTTAIGNHELYEENYIGVDMETQLFGKYFPYPVVDRRYWSFDYGPVHVTIVDQYPPYYDPYGQGLIDAAQLTWIESDLSSTDRKWKLIVLHEPGWSAGGSSQHPENNLEVQELLQPLCEQYGVQIVFGGHNHYYARACMNGVYHLTVGGGGAPLYTPYSEYPNIILAQRENHFCKLEIVEDTLVVRVLDITNAVIDSFEVIDGTLPSHILGSVSIDSGGGNVQDVLIAADGSSVNPDECGYYGMNLTPGIYDVTASLAGYAPQLFEDVEILYGTETTLDIAMIYTSIGDTGVKFETFFSALHPNPFGAMTTISYQLAAPSMVQLTVFDISGRRVRSLVNDQQAGGNHSVIWNGADENGRGVSTGVYFCILSAGEYTESRKVVLIR